MRRTPKNLVFHELVGLEVFVSSHTSSSLVGVKGLVVSESKNMLEVLSSGKVIKIPKVGGLFTFKLDDGTNVTVYGDAIVGRPEDRMKKIAGG
ncbi:MAG: ribonuclease P protein component 1 [Desulfurococcaceae archaeon TW002]